MVREITAEYIELRLERIKNRRVKIRAERAALEKECELMDQEEFELMCLQDKINENVGAPTE